MNTAERLDWDDCIKLLNQLHDDKNYRFELMIAMILFKGLNVSETLAVTKDKLLILSDNHKDFSTICNRCLDYIDTIKSDEKVFKFSRQFADKELKKIKIKYNLSHVKTFSAHSFRKTFAYNQYQISDKSSNSLKIIGKRLNHYNIRDTKRYLGIPGYLPRQISKQRFIPSPIPFAGSKFRLLDQITPEFDYSKETFVDLFCGSGAVYSNVASCYNNIIVNDIIKELVDIQSTILNYTQEFLSELKSILPEAGDKDAYYALRESYNQHKTPVKLFALICSCNTNMIRFNNNYEFNQSPGQLKGYNATLEKKIINFANVLDLQKQKINFSACSFEDVVIPDNSMVYIDAPYCNTEAGYNRYWNEELENKLYEYLINIHNSGNSFLVSGTFLHNNKSNRLLMRLISYGFKHKDIISHYRGVSKRDKNSFEIIIFNY